MAKITPITSSRASPGFLGPEPGFVRTNSLAGKPEADGQRPCRICGIPTKKPNGHYRCVSLVARRKRYVELVDQARHMAQVAGDYVRARI